MAQNDNIIRNGDFQNEKPQLNIGVGIFVVILAYLIVSLVMFFNQKHIVGYEVVKGSLSTQNVYDGIILRTETVYNAAGPGYINFFAREGEHLACNDLIYSLDSTGKIAEMIESQEGEMLLDDSDLGEIREQAIIFQNEFDKKQFQSVYTFKDQLEGTTLKLSNYNMLSNMNMLTEAGGNLSFQYAPKSGVVSYLIDGYEDLEPGQVTKEIVKGENYESGALASNQLVSAADKAFKLIDSENWSIVIPVDADQLAKLREKQYVQVRFLKNQYVSWAKLTPLQNTDGTYLQLDFTNSMITFASDRYISVELLYNQEEGLKVPNCSIIDKEFYLIPLKFKIEGGNGSGSGFLRETYDDEGNQLTEHIDIKIYYSDDEYYYVDDSSLRPGDYICNEAMTEKYPISKVRSLQGVYNMNKGYADFTAVTVMYANEEYSIIKSNTKYGLSEYDYIVLNAESVNPDDFIYE